MGDNRNLGPAKAAVETYVRHPGMDRDAAITDLIADLLHLADTLVSEDAAELGGEGIADRALMHYRAESAEETER